MIAVIETGAKQYLVKEGELLEVELLTANKTVNFTPLLIIDGDNTHVGKPLLQNAQVVAEVVELSKRDKKIKVLKYKPKKRQHTMRGHRQNKTVLKITDISLA